MKYHLPPLPIVPYIYLGYEQRGLCKRGSGIHPAVVRSRTWSRGLGRVCLRGRGIQPLHARRCRRHAM